MNKTHISLDVKDLGCGGGLLSGPSCRPSRPSCGRGYANFDLDNPAA